MKIYTGVIKEVTDIDKYLIDVDIKSYGVMKSVPLRFENEPKAGDEVLVILLDELFESTSVYIPFRHLTEEDFIGIRRHGYKVQFLNEEGGILISSDDEVTINIDRKTVTAQIGDIKIDINKSKGKVEVTAADVVVKASKSCEITGGGELKVKGVTTPSNTGPLNCITVCPFSGIPHAGIKATGI